MTTKTLSMVRTAFGLLMALLATDVFAWGKEGHQVVANLAATQLTAKARAEVDRLLALEPGAILQTISTWADEHRNPQTASWHYVNFPRDTCAYDAARDCPDGNCVVGVITGFAPCSAISRWAFLRSSLRIPLVDLRLFPKFRYQGKSGNHFWFLKVREQDTVLYLSVDFN